VLYVLPNSPAYEAGIKRGDWIVAAGSDTPNVTSISTYGKGGATTFLLAKYSNNQFYKDRTVSISASREVEDTPFLSDSVYSINGKTIGYLLYNTFASGPDNKDETYDTQLKQIFSKFKTKNVDEFVLDLRYNQGGLVTSARLMTSYLVPAADLGKTFCSMEYNDKHESENKDLALLKNSDLLNANLNLKRIYILTGNTTASASEAVINCLIPYLGRSNITLIGEKTIGKRVGSNTFGENEKYGWLLHPITLRIYNASHNADYANGFSPDISLKEVVIGNELYPFGDTRDLLLNKAVSLITGQSLKSENVYYSRKSDLVYPSIGHKIKGLIYEPTN
jgi:carboxyl-terminal processing protease